MIDPKDIVYLAIGLALFGLSSIPLACGKRFISVPTMYVAAGALLALTPFAVPMPDPLDGYLSLRVVEHATELIVIIALAAAGLAVDRQAGGAEWQHSWALLGLTMPLTIIGIYVLGTWTGLSVGAALLLAASLAPTDPVLARSVAVEGPNEGDEDDVRVSLTTEAGLNDGLAFPFVWLAIGVAEFAGDGLFDSLAGVAQDWLLMDVLWRIAAAVGIGWCIGLLSGKFVTSKYGDMENDGENAGLVFLGTTFLAYGVTEAAEGYGFLAVFIAARAGRANTRGTENDDYVRKPHVFGDQAEKVLLGILLVWLGTFAASGVLEGLTWREVALALAVVFMLRPVAGYLSLLCTRGTHFQRLAIAFFGIRGMGSFFYVAFGLATAESGAFGDPEPIWRITVITVLISIVVHGALAPLAMARVDRERASQKTPATS
ncbi:cation:proton antiporter domain-containing protein [Aurantiacibacter sediminis]|uniref:Cation:proton antiporter n=1 Tax=Aurantiacibacter sediminis TaxID=2793064 RepID=A0ABS0MZ79_9SPHN|nr:cation:proton antiporter [Aurantiacibacter sediminis]MBH5321016.1 cation:proton antiporter [Aurantiacibacter sediminis]